MATIWRPAGEAASCANLTAFIEWRHAVADQALDGPEAVWAWAAAAPQGFAAAVLGFAGVAPGARPAEALAAAPGRLVLLGAGGRRAIDPVAPAGFSRAALALAVADHLLRLDLRPDQTVLWPGPADDPWPLGTLLAGCTLLLCATPPDDPVALAAAEGAVLLRRPA